MCCVIGPIFWFSISLLLGYFTNNFWMYSALIYFSTLVYFSALSGKNFQERAFKISLSASTIVFVVLGFFVVSSFFKINQWAFSLFSFFILDAYFHISPGKTYLLVKPDGTIVGFSSKFKKVFPDAEAELGSSLYSHLCEQPDGNCPIERISQAQEGETQNFEWVHKKKTGEIFITNIKLSKHNEELIKITLY